MARRDSKSYSNPMPRALKMIEDAIKNTDEFPSVDTLRQSLAGKLSGEEIGKAPDRLEESNKIMFDKKGTIVWIYADNRKLIRMLSSSTEL